MTRVTDIIETLTDAGFDHRINVSTDVISIQARSPKGTIDIWGSDEIDVMRPSDRDFTEFRGPRALEEAIAFATS